MRYYRSYKWCITSRHIEMQRNFRVFIKSLMLFQFFNRNLKLVLDSSNVRLRLSKDCWLTDRNGLGQPRVTNRSFNLERGKGAHLLSKFKQHSWKTWLYDALLSFVGQCGWTNLPCLCTILGWWLGGNLRREYRNLTRWLAHIPNLRNAQSTQRRFARWLHNARIHPHPLYSSFKPP